MSKSTRLTSRFEVTRGCPVLHIDGILDATTAAMFRHDVEELVASGYKTLVLDFQNVSFMDSSGIGALIYVHRSLQEQGGKHLWLGGCNPQVQSLLEVTQLDKQIHCDGSLATVIDSWLAANPH